MDEGCAYGALHLIFCRQLPEAFDKLLRFGDRLVHFPVSCDKWCPHYNPPKIYLSLIAASPGSSLPSRYSSEAPPPVEICEKSSSYPSEAAAAAESPPPMIVTASSRPASALHTPIVPCAKFSNSKTPIGPFQTTVLASPRCDLNVSTVSLPISSPIISSGMSSTETVRWSASAANSSATTASTGRTILSPPASSSDFARSTLSSSSRDVPISLPCALKNV